MTFHKKLQNNERRAVYRILRMLGYSVTSASRIRDFTLNKIKLVIKTTLERGVHVNL